MLTPRLEKRCPQTTACPSQQTVPSWACIMSHCAQSHETGELGLSPIEETTVPEDTEPRDTRCATSSTLADGEDWCLTLFCGILVFCFTGVVEVLNTTSVAANRSPNTGWLGSRGSEEVPTSAESEVNRLKASNVNNNTYIVRQCVWYGFEKPKTVASFSFRATSA